jgi:hypothetical protein
LRAAGVDPTQAEAHATAARDFIMPELATRADIITLEGQIARLEGQIERQTLVLTLRLGGLMIAGVGALALILRLGA